MQSCTAAFAQLTFGISFISSSDANGSSVMLMFFLISECGSLTDRALNNGGSGLTAPGSWARTQRRHNEQGWLCDGGGAEKDLRVSWVCVCVCV